MNNTHNLDLTQVQIFNLSEEVQVKFTPVNEEKHVCENVEIYCKMTTGQYIFQSRIFGLAAKDFILACYKLIQSSHTIPVNIVTDLDEHYQTEYRCSVCNNVVQPYDRYCSECGEKLRSMR